MINTDWFRIVDQVRGDSFLPSYSSVFTPINYSISDNQIIIEVPGYAREDFSIEVEGNTLLVRSSNKKIVYDFVIQDNVDVSGISAQVDKGILTIDMPRITPKSRKIEIK